MWITSRLQLSSRRRQRPTRQSFASDCRVAIIRLRASRGTNPPRAPFPGGWQSEGLTGGCIKFAILPIAWKRVIVGTTPRLASRDTPLGRGDEGVSKQCRKRLYYIILQPIIRRQLCKLRQRLLNGLIGHTIADPQIPGHTKVMPRHHHDLELLGLFAEFHGVGNGALHK